jgi:anti-sigma28 factor (negative regulator of flagellin synthesis)
MPKIKSEKVKAIKKAIKNGTYDWKAGIEGAATKIVNNPEVLLWR